MSQQENEIRRDIYVYGAIGISGAALISGGIYAVYAQRQINALRKRNIRLSNKISKIEGVIKGLSKDNVSFGKELANNVSLAMENRKYIEALGGNFDELADLVEEQAEKYGHSQTRELAFLTAHSMLHLSGYDHMEEEERLEMERMQREILERRGYRR